MDPGEKIRIVEEAYLPGMSVSIVTHKNGVGRQARGGF